MPKNIDWDRSTGQKRVYRKGSISSRSLAIVADDPVVAAEAEAAAQHQRRLQCLDLDGLDPIFRRRLNKRYRQQRLHAEAIGQTFPNYIDWMAEQVNIDG